MDQTQTTLDLDTLFIHLREHFEGIGATHFLIGIPHDAYESPRGSLRIGYTISERQKKEDYALEQLRNLAELIGRGRLTTLLHEDLEPSALAGCGLRLPETNQVKIEESKVEG